MKNMAGLCLFGITLFFVGIFAGRQVKQSLQPAPFVRASDVRAGDAGRTNQNDRREAVIQQASFQANQEPADGLFQSDEPLRANEPLRLSPTPKPLEITTDNIRTTPEPVGGKSAEDTMQIIQNVCPEIDQATAEAWSIEMAGMSREDIEFLLEQRRAAGIRSFGSFLNDADASGMDLNAGGSQTQSVRPPVSVRPPTIEGPACPTALQQAIAQSLRNLSGMNAIGYRRSVVFLTPGHGTGQAETAFPSWTYSAVRDFKCGELMQTFAPLHVALPPDPKYMFVLADSLLTRRGDFTILPGGRLGLATGSEEHIVEGVETIPEDSALVSIAETGVVVAKLPDGSLKSLGRISIAQVSQPGVMSSDDGVFFRCSAGLMEIVGEKAVVSLQTGFVETANVISDSEWKTLEHFRKLEQEWVRMMPASSGFTVY